MNVYHFSRFPSLRPMAALAVGLVFSFTAANAEARPEMAGENALADRFTVMDTDKDGKVSRLEFTTALPNMRDTAFDAMDENKDGFLTLEEWQKAMAEHMRMSMPPAGGMGGQGGGNATAPAGMGGQGGGNATLPAGMGGAPAGGATTTGPDLVMPSDKKP